MTPTVLHLFCGLGGGALGFKRAGFRGVGAFDTDAAACRDLEALTGDRATVADLSAMSPEELRAACTGRPDVVFTSPPCKSFSGCLPASTAATPEYEALSDLALRGIWLALEAWPVPPALFVMENVPRIMSRGRRWLDQLTGLLRGYGYAVRETTHDCGELGGLAQRRRRFLLVARHVEQVPELLYEPPKKPLRGIGEILGELPVPVPGSSAGGPMHLLPRLSALNWVRLALIPAGGDWRDLPESVALAHRAARQNGGFGVEEWSEPAHAIVAEGSVRNTRVSLADPRLSDRSGRFSGPYWVEEWSAPSHTVIASAHPSLGRGAAISDPRIESPRREGSMGVTPWDGPSTTVIAKGRIQNGPWQVADPRVECSPRTGSYGVRPWAEPSHTVLAHATSDKGFNVADPRMPVVLGELLDLQSKRPVRLVIRAVDGTWHRPMTTLELAAIQGFPVGGEETWLQLDGRAHGAWRQRIGNAVPPPAAEAIARSCAATLGASRNGEILLSSARVWVERRCE